jgi:hypothetical protein
MNIHLASIKVLFFVIAVSFCLVCVTKFVVSRAQDAPRQKSEWKVKKVGPKRMASKTKEPDFLESDRIIEDQLPPRLPIQIEIKIKHLETDSLLRDLEIKVTNTANKSIYFLQLGVVLPENLSPDGYPIDFPLQYGRPELIKFENPLEPIDTPILPGESVVLKIPENNLVAFERLVTKGRIIQAEVKRVYLMFRHLNFGDKTGFSGDGSPVPYIRKERSTNNCYQRIDLNTVQYFKSPNRSFPDVFDGAMFLKRNFLRESLRLSQIYVARLRHLRRLAHS